MTSRDWDRAYAACELTFSIEPHPDVEAALGAVPPGSALELGCGEGRHAIWLATRGWRVMAVDFSPVAVNRGRLIAAHHGVDVSWVVADLVAAVDGLQVSRAQRLPQVGSPDAVDALLVAHRPSAEPT